MSLNRLLYHCIFTAETGNGILLTIRVKVNHKSIVSQRFLSIYMDFKGNEINHIFVVDK